MEKLPKRKSPRLAGYDYSTVNYYFITICTCDKIKLFGEPEKLNEFGKIAADTFLQIPQHFDCIEIDKFVIMPNHVHAIVIIHESTTTLTTVIGQYKAYVSKKIHEIKSDLPVWQRSFHDHVIRNQHSYEKIWNYIDTNPMKWQDDCFYY